MCKDYSTELLGSLPLDIRIREQTDAGRPTVVADPDGQVAEIYRSIARRIAVKVDELSQDYSELFAKIVIEDN
jgi:ATP-binding protein involved in chromosome partitioning